MRGSGDAKGASAIAVRRRPVVRLRHSASLTVGAALRDEDLAALRPRLGR